MEMWQLFGCGDIPCFRNWNIWYLLSLWCLQNADTGNFSVYVHSEPGFVFDESTTRSSFFYDRQLTNSIKVSGVTCLLCCYIVLQFFFNLYCVPLVFWWPKQFQFAVAWTFSSVNSFYSFSFVLLIEIFMFITLRYYQEMYLIELVCRDLVGWM